MSRLYGWIRSDTRKATITSAGHKEIEAQINWGSINKSMLAGRIAVSWDRDEEKPTLYIETGDVKVVMDGKEIKTIIGCITENMLRREDISGLKLLRRMINTSIRWKENHEEGEI